MRYLNTLQRVLEPLPVRGKSRLAEIILSRVNGEVDCHPVYGVSVCLRTNQRIERWMWAGAYEPKLVSLMKRILKPGMTAIDLGANIGYFSTIAAALVGEKGKVYAFEPMPENFARLQRNLKPFTWAVSYASAVGKVTGEVVIRYSDKEAGWASIHEDHVRDNLPCSSVVSVIRLDHWLETHRLDRVDFMKLDIEGSELDALLGAEAMVSRFRPTIVAETKCGWHYNEICELLGAKGYNCRSFQGDSVLAIPRL